jgi:hypothetical protein
MFGCDLKCGGDDFFLRFPVVFRINPGHFHILVKPWGVFKGVPSIL